MILEEKKGIKYYTFNTLKNKKKLLHFVSTKKTGYSYPPYNLLNLKFPDGRNQTKRNHNKFREALNPENSPMIFLKQIHSNKVIEINSVPETRPKGDAIISNKKNLCLNIFAADCAPVLFYDPIKKVIGAAHSGWKGTSLNIAGNTIKKMSDRYNSKPENIISCIGPSIGQKHYEIKEDVAKIFRNKFSENDIEKILLIKNNKLFLSLKTSIKIQLLNSGLQTKNIEVSELCTYENSEYFFSYRRKDKYPGRFITGIMML